MHGDFPGDGPAARNSATEKNLYVRFNTLSIPVALGNTRGLHCTLPKVLNPGAVFFWVARGLSSAKSNFFLFAVLHSAKASEYC